MARKARAAFAVAVLVALFPACACASQLPGLLTQIGSGSTFRVRPAQIIYTGDGSGILGGFTGKGPLHHFGALKWSLWGQSQAVGSGAVWLDDCEPNCAQGTFHPFVVKVHAFEQNAGHFTHLTLRYVYEGKEIIDRRHLFKLSSGYVW
jgi:hypothetical protein